MADTMYRSLSDDIQTRIRLDRKNGCKNPLAASDSDIIRRFPEHDRANLWRPAYVRDIEKIMYLPYYNRYADKTQVISFCENDDITRRAQHIQMVSRIARNLGAVLGLNPDLIEAISLGHDIGHTPFGHAGERCLEKALSTHTGGTYHFMHNVQSARILDTVFLRNVSLAVLDGIICHNGEAELPEYKPSFSLTFDEYDDTVAACLRDRGHNSLLVASTLEGCVMRISDIIAYLGKDRDDAALIGMLSAIPKAERSERPNRTGIFSDTPVIGNDTSQMINNLIVDIIENSYGKDGIYLSREAFSELKTAKQENYRYIYNNPEQNRLYRDALEPMFLAIYDRLLEDLTKHRETSLIYRHHLSYIAEQTSYYRTYQKDRYDSYLASDPNLIVMDYISSMTDDYFLSLYRELFPEDGARVPFRGYFG